MMLSHELYYNINTEFYSLKMAGSQDRTVLKHICVCAIIYSHFHMKRWFDCPGIWYNYIIEYLVGKCAGSNDNI